MPEALALFRHTGVQLLVFFFLLQHFIYFLLSSPHRFFFFFFFFFLFFFPFLCSFDVYVLGDVALMSKEPFTRTDQMSCVYHSRIKGEGCSHEKSM